jgi:hypothetical protein
MLLATDERVEIKPHFKVQNEESPSAQGNRKETFGQHPDKYSSNFIN